MLDLVDLCVPVVRQEVEERTKTTARRLVMNKKLTPWNVWINTTLKKKGISMREFSRLVEVDRASVSQWSSGHSRWPRLSKYLKVKARFPDVPPFPQRGKIEKLWSANLSVEYSRYGNGSLFETLNRIEKKLDKLLGLCD